MSEAKNDREHRAGLHFLCLVARLIKRVWRHEDFNLIVSFAWFYGAVIFLLLMMLGVIPWHP